MILVRQHWWLVFYLLFLILLVVFLFDTSDELKEANLPSEEELEFNVTRAMEHLQEINRITEINGGRNAGTDGSLETAAYVEETFRKAGVDHVESQEFQAGEMKLKNVLGWLPGKMERQIIIAAHHDSAGQIPGMIDNASGVAVVLVLAELLSGKQRQHTLCFNA